MWIVGLLGFALSTTQPEVLYIDASRAGGVPTQNTLVAGATYVVQVRGTISKWAPRAMTSLCTGTADPTPQFPSKSVTGPASVDAEWVWAWPTMSPTLCPNGNATKSSPVAERTVFVNLGTSTKAAPLPPPSETTMTANHTYTYRIIGQGAPAVFVVRDNDYKDNYGQFQITVTAE